MVSPGAALRCEHWGAIRQFLRLRRTIRRLQWHLDSLQWRYERDRGRVSGATEAPGWDLDEPQHTCRACGVAGARLWPNPRNQSRAASRSGSGACGSARRRRAVGAGAMRLIGVWFGTLREGRVACRRKDSRSSPIPRERGADLVEEVLVVTEAVAQPLDDLDLHIACPKGAGVQQAAASCQQP